jgi:L-rhamnose isomerase
MLEPFALLREAELSGDYTARLALHEEFSRLPAAAVWDYVCMREGKPVGLSWLDAVRKYEADVTFKR